MTLYWIVAPIMIEKSVVPFGPGGGLFIKDEPNLLVLVILVRSIYDTLHQMLKS